MKEGKNKVGTFLSIEPHFPIARVDREISYRNQVRLSCHQLVYADVDEDRVRTLIIRKGFYS